MWSLRHPLHAGWSPPASPLLRRLLPLGLLALALALNTTAFAADDNAYVRQNLVSDTGDALHTDPDLVNAWGVAFNPFGFVWVAANGSGKSTLYDGFGVKQSLVVSIPAGKPTGIVFNAAFSAPGNTAFAVGQGTSAPAAFLFATENGVIAGWAPSVDLTNAVEAFRDREAIFKGVALAANGHERFLYATDFHNGRVLVLDSRFDQVQASGGFEDPDLPAGYAPFGIQNIGGDLYVTYALQDADREDDVACAGCGFVDVFTPNGVLIRRVASGGPLNAPWGLAMAPAKFGKFSGHLLVGNFGDGRISAFDPARGEFRGQLRLPGGHPLQISGLWGLSFGNGLERQPVNVLYFAAGPDDEAHGVFGRIAPAAPAAASVLTPADDS